MLIATVVVQGYHIRGAFGEAGAVSEHRSSGNSGFAMGGHFDGVIFHALMNTAVYLPAVVVFVCSGMHRQIFSRGYGARRP